MLHCLGNGQELLSALLVAAVCQDSTVFLTRQFFLCRNDISVVKVSATVLRPRVVLNIRASGAEFYIPDVLFLFLVTRNLSVSPM